MKAINNPLDWPEIEEVKPNKKQMEEAQAAQYEIDTAYFECFNSKSGKKVIAHLIGNTRDAGTWLGSLPYEKAIAHGFAREGQNALIKDIEKRIESGRTAKNKPEQKND